MTRSIAPPISEQTEQVIYPRFARVPSVEAREREYAIRLPRLPSVLVSFQDVAPEWLHGTVEAIRRMSDLERGWDSYGARRIENHAILRALVFILNYVSLGAPHVAPTSKGGVQVEWNLPAVELEIEFDQSGIVGAYVEDLSRNTGRELSQADFPGSELPPDILRLFT